jgi:hypothetical protein
MVALAIPGVYILAQNLSQYFFVSYCKSAKHIKICILRLSYESRICIVRQKLCVLVLDVLWILSTKFEQLFLMQSHEDTWS